MADAEMAQQQQQAKRDLARLESKARNQIESLQNAIDSLSGTVRVDLSASAAGAPINTQNDVDNDKIDLRTLLSNVDLIESDVLEMREVVRRLSAAGAPFAVVQSYTGRVDDVAFDLRRLRSVAKDLVQRDALFGDRKGGSADVSDRFDQLVRERSSISSSQQMADDLRAQAGATRDQLYGQNRVISGTQSRLSGALQRFPEIQGIMNKIKTKKWKNQVIVYSAIAVGLIFIIWYYAPAKAAATSSPEPQAGR